MFWLDAVRCRQKRRLRQSSAETVARRTALKTVEEEGKIHSSILPTSEGFLLLQRATLQCVLQVCAPCFVLHWWWVSRIICETHTQVLARNGPIGSQCFVHFVLAVPWKLHVLCFRISSWIVSCPVCICGHERLLSCVAVLFGRHFALAPELLGFSRVSGALYTSPVPAGAMPSSLVVDIQGAVWSQDALALQNAISKAQEERDALDYWIGKGKQQMAV